ncbi:MFS transporter [Aliiglaciecola litoralis]|uniref:MFS transporter n=1 Tax=Aliiglaciecola litoralis TaxID=582857 RepID=A0ABP3WYS9_9ALTE
MALLSQKPQSNLNLLLISLTYLLYFGQLGVLVPYLGVFLDGRGFTSEQIGELFALITVARILGPNLWASMADKSGKGLGILRLGSLLTFGTFCLVFVVDSFWGLTLGFALMMMFWTAILPQLEVLTLNCVDSDATRYSRIRLWGSIGFIILTVIAGKAIDMFSSEAPIYVSAGVLAVLFISTLLINEPQAKPAKDKNTGSIWHKAKTPTFLMFILSAILLQVSFGTYYGFFALYARDLGYSGQATGFFIGLGVAAEIVIFLLAGRLISIFGIKWILVISIFLTALRWLLLGTVAEFLWVIIISQLLHAFSFGMTHAASVKFIHHYFGKAFQSRGQALYISIGFGVGGAIGNYISGQLWLQGAGSQQAFLFSAVIALISMLSLLLVRSKNMSASA